MFANRLVVFNLALSLTALGFMQPPVHAGIIDTGMVLEQRDRAQQVARIQSMLAEHSVHSRLVSLGVDPALASARVARLTDAELRLLEARMDELPAGGDSLLAVIGVLFVVLLILELVGVTDIFQKI
jgi:hypothetical protein